MRFSVVIPTFNRAEILRECIRALWAQDFDKKDFEIIIVNDGSNDETEKTLQSIKKSSPIAFSFINQKNQGQGVARNAGVKQAQGEMILLIGDDCIATSQLLKEHARIHELHPEENAAVLGFITWHPKLSVTPLMRFMEKGGAILGRFGGHQFAYDLLEGKQTADYRFFYTSNISLKRSLLLKFPFDPWFAGYGWEDIELAIRLTKKAAMTVYYASDAIIYHDHMMRFEDFQRRMRAIGEASHRIHERYPELRYIPSRKKKAIFKLISNRLSLAVLKNIHRNLYYYALSKKYFLEGMESVACTRPRTCP